MTITRLQPGKRMSQAVKHGNTVYLAGQVASDPNGTIEKQTAEVLAAIDKLAEAGTSKSKMLSCQVILNNIGDFRRDELGLRRLDRFRQSAGPCLHRSPPRGAGAQGRDHRGRGTGLK